MTLLEFLKDRLDEDEDKAKAAVDRKAGYVEGWAEFDGDAGDFLGPFGTFLPDKYTVSDCDTPERVLDEVEVKRRILARHPHRRFTSLPSHWPSLWKKETPVVFPGTDEPYVGCENCDYNHELEQLEPGEWCDYVKDLASVYADHPDYQEAWQL